MLGREVWGCGVRVVGVLAGHVGLKDVSLWCVVVWPHLTCSTWGGGVPKRLKPHTRVRWKLDPTID